MTYRGHIKNGVIVLDENPKLEGMIVEVPAVSPKSLADRMRNIIGISNDLPTDFAENHDHYIHGTRK